jgi:hypothetical protein
MKKVDNYSWGVLCFFIAVLVIIIGYDQRNVNFWVIASICVICGFVFVYKAMRSGGYIVENKYEKSPVYTKDENTGVVRFLPDFSTRDDIDGIGFKNFPDGKSIYKVCNGIKVYIDEFGTVNPTTIIGIVVNKLFGGGYKTREWARQEKEWKNIIRIEELEKEIETLQKSIHQ